MEHISKHLDLFGRERTVLPAGRFRDERSELIDWFCAKVHRRPRQLGVRLAHYSLSQLYALKSGWEDRERRDGFVRAEKWWWWTTKTEEV